MRVLLPVSRRCSSSQAQPGRRACDALRILFCGSDDFSIASLRALANARLAAPRLIESIHVLHRPSKPTGRHLKTLAPVPIRRVAADELQLPTHAVDSFTGWTPPRPINLVVAVSFGLLVPPRILGLAQYGGLNVHPSLLPDLHGPAPIEHAIWKRRKHTGVSVQTLHPHHFDKGTILAQTPLPGIAIPPGSTADSLRPILAEAGAAMLLQVLQLRTFFPPLQLAATAASDASIDHAPKLTKQDRFVDFHRHTMEDIVSAHLALGDLWCILPNGHRLIIHKLADLETLDSLARKPGIWVESKTGRPTFRASCGKVGVIDESTYAGAKARHGNAKLLHMCPVEETDIL